MAKKLRGRRTALSLLSALSMGAMMAAPAATAMAASPADVSTSQVYGLTRFQTAVQIANQLYPNGPSSKTVVITSGADANLVDALTAAPLAKALGAPILLAESPTTLGSAVTGYLSQYGITKVVLIGAVGSNASTIASQLPSGVSIADTYTGATRFQTAAAIAQALMSLEGKTSFSTVFVASGEQPNLVDALAGDPVAAEMGDPILLASSSGTTLPSTREQSILSASSAQFVLGAAGSYPVVSSMTNATKLQGNDRFQTAVQIDQHFAPTSGYGAIVVANGDQAHLVDALTGGPLAAADNAALVLVDNGTIPNSTSLFLENSTYDQATSVTVFGGPASIPSQAVSNLSGLVTLATSQQVAPASATVSAADGTVLSDGAETDAVTVSVVGANGALVRDFAGTASANVTLPSGDTFVSGTGTSGLTITSGTVSGSVTFSNGTGTFTLPAVTGSATGSATITLSDFVATSGVTVPQNFPVVSSTITVALPSATGLKLTSQLPDISVNSASPDTLSVQVTDAAGNPISANELVTFTLSGQGSFAQSSAQTSATVLTGSNGSASVTIYSEQANPGTITVTAAASGLTSASISIPTYETGQPDQLAITSTTTTSGGITYTAYTVDVEDVNGHVTSTINPPDGLTVTATPNGGYLNLYANASSATSGESTPATGTGTITASLNVTNGQAQFVVDNQAIGTAAAGLEVSGTVSGQSLNGATLSASATYQYQVGTATKVTYTPAAAPSGLLATGTSRTVTVQVEDANGNPLDVSGQQVDFWFASSPTGVTFPNGSAPTSSSSAYVVDTGSNGQASVTVNIGSSASGTFQVDAELAGTSGVASGTLFTVAPSSGGAIASSVAVVSGLSGTYTAGSPVSGTIALDNGLGGVASGNSYDTVEITSSNSGVVSVNSGSGWSVVSGSSTSVTGQVSAGEIVVPSGVLTAEGTGTATLTISDLSNPAATSATETITVQVGSYQTANLVAVAPSGSTSGQVSVPSGGGIEGPFMVEVQDAGGNLLPAPENITIPVMDLIAPTGSTAMIVYSSGMPVLAVGSSSSNVNIGLQGSITLPADGAPVPIYISVASGTSSGTLTATSSGVPLDSVVPIASTVAVSVTSAATGAGKALVTNLDGLVVTAGSSASMVLEVVGNPNGVSGVVYGSEVTGSIASDASGATVTGTFSSGLVSGVVYQLVSISNVTDAYGNSELVVGTVSGS